MTVARSNRESDRADEGTAQIERLLLPVPDAAQVVSLGDTKMWELIGSGDIVAVKVGRRTLVPLASLDRFVERLIADAESASGGGAQ